MSRWFYCNYKGYQICKWSDSDTYFITKDGDINDPYVSNLASENICKDYIDCVINMKI